MAPTAALRSGTDETVAAHGPDRLVARAAGGDDEAFAALVRRYDRPLRALAYRLLGDADRMDDALQEAYVKAYRALPEFRGDAQVGTWLYRIVYNACMDELRRERGRGSGQAPSSYDDLSDRPDEAPGPDERTLLRNALEVALAALPPDQRAVVVLVDAQGFDYPAAGAVLGVAVGTVASRLSRARAALRRVLGDAGAHTGADADGGER